MMPLIPGRWYWVAQHPRKALNAAGLCITADRGEAIVDLELFEPLTYAWLDFVTTRWQRQPGGPTPEQIKALEEMREQLDEDRIAYATRHIGANATPDPDWQDEVWRRIDAGEAPRPYRGRAVSALAFFGILVIAIGVGICAGWYGIQLISRWL